MLALNYIITCRIIPVDFQHIASDPLNYTYAGHTSTRIRLITALWTDIQLVCETNACFNNKQLPHRKRIGSAPVPAGSPNV